MIKPGKKLYSAIAGAAAVCLLTGGIGYQAVASGTAGQTPEDISATEVREENADGTFSEEYNGPGKLAWDHCGKMQKNGQRPISLAKLRELQTRVPQSERLKRMM